MNLSKKFYFCIWRGLDNQVSIHTLNTDDDINKHKKVVATHSNYISDCKFMHSDQQVIDLINIKIIDFIDFSY